MNVQLDYKPNTVKDVYSPHGIYTLNTIPVKNSKLFGVVWSLGLAVTF